MARMIDIDDFEEKMKTMGEKAKADGCNEVLLATQMAIYQVELYASTYGTKEG